MFQQVCNTRPQTSQNLIIEEGRKGCNLCIRGQGGTLKIKVVAHFKNHLELTLIEVLNRYKVVIKGNSTTLIEKIYLVMRRPKM